MEFGDLFSFDKKIAPAIIKPIYWVGLVLIVLGGIIFFLDGFFRIFSHPLAGMWDMVMAVLSVIFGALSLRIGAEICLAVFEIHERTTGATPQS
jgi:hypothetical protein